MPGTTTTTAPPSGNVAPDSQVTAPAVGATVGSPYTFAGTATDDASVTRVRMAVRNAATQQWLQANGSFGPTFAQFDATLSQPNAASTGWTWACRHLPAGSYYVQSKAVDNTSTSETVDALGRLLGVLTPRLLGGDQPSPSSLTLSSGRNERVSSRSARAMRSSTGRQISQLVTLTVASSLEVTTREPSWLNRAAVTQLVWPRTTESRLAVLASQIRAVPSTPAVTMSWSSLL